MMRKGRHVENVSQGDESLALIGVEFNSNCPDCQNGSGPDAVQSLARSRGVSLEEGFVNTDV